VLARRPIDASESLLGTPSPERAAEITEDLEVALSSFGHEAGQYAVLGPDPWWVLWNDDRSGFIAFLEGRRGLLTWRSPVSHPHEQALLLGRLVRHARTKRKTLFAIEVNATTNDAGVALGMTSIWTGTENFLDLATWSLLGGRRQKIRWARRHAEKLGLQWREAFPLSNTLDEHGVGHVQHAWKAERTERETDSFLRTDFGEIARLRRYFVCEGPEGIVAFVTCTPVNAEGWYLQDIVRLPSAPRGALEGAMAFALDVFRDDGYRFVSNGPLPFWRPGGESEGQQKLGFVGQRALRFFNDHYRFHGINQFRSKLEPDCVSDLYVLRSKRLITPGALRTLTKLLSERTH
jgi:lysylphosphatidylglycerol synthetase-like protein (DUF2156 family)